ncbi:hypothetical protein C4K01_1549 [Pseudomonas synxantha]|nr:hypothetical protein C4K01_1549 [Pseudomonas synxantha]
MKEKDRIAAGSYQPSRHSLAFLALSIATSFATGFFYLGYEAMIAPIFYSGELP